MDKRNDQHLDKIFREKLIKHQMDVPNDIWDAIEANLSDRPVVRIPLWKRLWFVAASFLLLASASVSLMYRGLKDENEKSNIQIIQQVEPEPLKPNLLIESLPETNRMVATSAEAKASGGGPVKVLTAASFSRSVVAADTNEYMAEEDTDLAAADAQMAEPQENQIDEIVNDEERQAKIRAFEQLGADVSKQPGNEYNKTDRATHKSGVSINFGNSGFSNQATKNAEATLRRYATKYNAELMQMVRPAGQIEDAKVKHFTPLSLAVMFDKELIRNLSAEIGVSYTYMRSELRSNSSFRNETQHLHYLGVPLAFRYKVWSWKGLSAYVKAGGAIDFNIAGTWKEAYSYNADYGRGSLSAFDEALESRPQLSVNGAVGVGYSLSNLFQLYFEPGIAYYFDNNSYIINIRKDKPVDLSLQLGARFKF
ncbi:MAG: outer membrane beta-barrel protein [Bacteroidales bacterium]